MRQIKHSRAEQLFKELAADFVERHSNRTSLVTVTGIELTPSMSHATILLSVMPKEKAPGAIEAANRWKQEFREYVKSHARLRTLPFFDFAIDTGELNRQRIFDLLDSTTK
jgi:ribosome-binding factor A